MLYSIRLKGSIILFIYIRTRIIPVAIRPIFFRLDEVCVSYSVVFCSKNVPCWSIYMG